MAQLETLIPAVLTRDRADFTDAHRGFHLLKPPVVGKSMALDDETLRVADNDGLPPSFIIPSSSTWQSTRLVKRPGPSDSDHVSVGRDPCCDIVLCFPVVSKIHALFSFEPDGTLVMYDQGSSNGTWRNGFCVQAGDRVELAPGDELSFAGVCCELLDADGLYELVSGLRH